MRHGFDERVQYNILTINYLYVSCQTLYKNLSLGWGRAFLLGLGINIASYASVIVLEFALFVGYSFYGSHLDKKERSKWVHPEMLNQSTGLIYAPERHQFGESRLRVLDTKTGRWQTLTNCPPLQLNSWDVEGRTCAFVGLNSKSPEEEPVVIASLPDFSVIREISLISFVVPQSDKKTDWQGITDLSLSPDAKRLAVLFRVSKAVACKDQSSYYELGDKCALAVFDVDSGRQIIRASRWASSGGFCWFPDSSAVLFTSFKDETIYDTAKTNSGSSTGYGVGYTTKGQFQCGLFSLNIVSGQIRPFADGVQPRLSLETRQFAVREDDNIRFVDLTGTTKSFLNISQLNVSPAVFSPSGKLAVVCIWKSNPPMRGARLTIVDLEHPDMRHIIADDLVYRYKWTTTGDDVSAKTIHPLP